jgi:HAD superfamily hydrolase (TIGR01490 family)
LYAFVPADILALFDLDHTLLPRDSDEQWVAFLIERGALDRDRYDAANHDLTARFNRGEAGAIEFTEFYLSTLAPFDEDKLLQWRSEYIAQEIRPYISPAATALVDAHRSAGDLVVLTTAVFRFLADPIAIEFGIDHVIATEAQQVDGRYTGRITGQANMREGKFERLVSWLAARGRTIADFRESWFYADSLNDLPLLSRVTHPVVVNAGPVLAAHGRHMGWRELRIA